MSSFWKDYIEGVAPEFLKGANGGALIDALAAEKDALRDTTYDTIRAANASLADPSLYPMHLAERDLPVAASTETVEKTKNRLCGAFETHKLGGIDSGLIQALSVFGLGNRTTPSGKPTVIIKKQRDFSPSWDVERFASIAPPSYLTALGSAFQINDAVSAGFMDSSGFLGTFTVSVRWRVASTAIVSDEYIWYVNPTTSLRLNGTTGEYELRINGYVVTGIAPWFGAGDVVRYTVVHTSTALSLTASDTSETIYGAVAGAIPTRSIVVGGDSVGASPNKSFVRVSGPFPSPDPSLGWATEYIIVDGAFDQCVGRALDNSPIGSHFIGIKYLEGNAWTAGDAEGLRAYVRKVKASHITLPFIAVFLRREGLDPYLDERILTLTQDWSANDMWRTLIIEIDGCCVG